MTDRVLIVTDITPELVCDTCGAPVEGDFDQEFEDATFCAACHREAVSDHAYMFMEPYR